MTPPEFDKWLNQHQAFFPGLRAWFEKMDSHELQAVLGAWRSVLAGVPIADAIAASESLYEQSEQPRSYERHAAVVKSLARSDRTNEERRQTVAKFGGIETFKCPTCFDGGWATVYACGPLRDRCIEMYGPEVGPRTTFAVACDCPAGRELASKHKNGLPFLNRRFMQLFDVRGEKAQQPEFNPWDEIPVMSSETSF